MTGKDWQDLIARDFLEDSAAAFASPLLAKEAEVKGESPGDPVGRYRLVRELGRGGMGTVWVAERADGEFEQQVALKLIKRGMDSSQIVTRFLRERQILARLTSPDIARLLDGGMSADGRPYFVMELVDGEPITRHCDSKCLSIEARLELFIRVCRAVQQAHRNLVVHRDLKPSNVLVTARGEVKLLDFGVAKLLDPGESDELTESAGPLTPEYASPEQLAGTPVTTASDVYQLGVLLYELLAGRRPGNASDPAPPSTVVTRPGRKLRRDGGSEPIEPVAVSERRDLSPRQLRARLRGDLDAIVLHSVEREPERRYASADALADDCERHLAHVPVRAGSAGWSYRVGKFVRRNRLKLAVSSLLLVLATIATAIYVSQIRTERDRALRENTKASESAVLLRRLFEQWNPDAADRDKVSAAIVLSNAARRAERELERDPEMLASTLSLLGDLHGAIGNTAAADSLLLRARAIQEHRFGSAPSADLAATLSRQGLLLNRMERYREAELAGRRSLAIYRALLGPERIEVVRGEYLLAAPLIAQGKYAEAETLLRDALRHSPNQDAPFTTEIASELGWVLFNEGHLSEAVALLQPTLERQQRLLGSLHPSTIQTMRSLASSLRDWQHQAEAEALDRQAVALATSLYGSDGSETRIARNALAALLERKGSLAESESLLVSVLQNIRRFVGEQNLDAALLYRSIGGLQLMRGDFAGADTTLRRSLATFRAVDPGNLDEGDVRNRLAYLVFLRGSPDSTEVYRDALAFEQARKPDGPFFSTDGYEFLGWAARRKGDLVLAERLLRRALGLYEREMPPGHPYRTQTTLWLNQLHNP